MSEFPFQIMFVFKIALGLNFTMPSYSPLPVVRLVILENVSGKKKWRLWPEGQSISAIGILIFWVRRGRGSVGGLSSDKGIKVLMSYKAAKPHFHPTLDSK